MPAKPPQVRIVPQRHSQQGWRPCEPHQAQAWAAFIGARLLGRYGNKALAISYAASALLHKAGPKRKFQLGSRCEARSPETKVYARSLTRAEYEAATAAAAKQATAKQATAPQQEHDQ